MWVWVELLPRGGGGGSEPPNGWVCGLCAIQQFAPPLAQIEDRVSLALVFPATVGTSGGWAPEEVMGLMLHDGIGHTESRRFPPKFGPMWCLQTRGNVTTPTTPILLVLDRKKISWAMVSCSNNNFTAVGCKVAIFLLRVLIISHFGRLKWCFDTLGASGTSYPYTARAGLKETGRGRYPTTEATIFGLWALRIAILGPNCVKNCHILDLNWFF